MARGTAPVRWSGRRGPPRRRGQRAPCNRAVPGRYLRPRPPGCRQVGPSSCRRSCHPAEWSRSTTAGLCEHDAPPNPGGAMTSTVTESVVSSTTYDTDTDTAVAADEVLAELLIEEISIDGMCGVY